MLDTSNLSNFLKGITDALRAKKGTTEPIEHKFIDEEIESITAVDTGIGSRQWWLDVCSEKTSFNNMFKDCTSLTTIPKIDVSKGTVFLQMFYGCTSLIEIPQLNISSGLNFTTMFYNCTSLITIHQLDTSSGTNFNNMFYNCTSLQNITFVAKCIKKSISFAHSGLLSDESVQSIIDGLADLTGQTSQTLSLHASVKEKLTEQQIAQITSKNWTLA